MTAAQQYQIIDKTNVVADFQGVLHKLIQAVHVHIDEELAAQVAHGDATPVRRTVKAFVRRQRGLRQRPALRMSAKYTRLSSQWR